MKYIKYVYFLLLIILVYLSWGYFKEFEEFKLIKVFSERLKFEEGIALSHYGVSDYPQKMGEYSLTEFRLGYVSHKTQKDIISVETARCMIVSIAESFLQEINSSLELKMHLEPYPFKVNGIKLALYYADENDIDLGNGGVTAVHLKNGKIQYDRYEIKEYKVPVSVGKTYLIHEESYADALEIVKAQGCLKKF